MTNQEAKRILVEKFGEGCFVKDDKLKEYFIEGVAITKFGRVFFVKNLWIMPDQREAIDQWIRDPVGVMNAEDKTT